VELPPTAAQPSSSTPYRGRWRRLILAVLLLYLCALGWGRLQQSLVTWDLLVQFGARPGPLYLALSGAAWGVLGLAGAALLLVRRAWAPRLLLALALVIALSYWADLLLLTRSAEALVSWPFALLLTLLGLLFTAWATGALRKSTFTRASKQGKL